MKQIIALFVAGGGAFLLAGFVSFLIYWNAPIVPCEVETRTRSAWGGYTSRRHDDLCTGGQVKGYEYPRVHHAKRKGHDGVVIGLFLGTLLVSMGAGFGALFLVGRREARRKNPGDTVTTADPAG